MRIKWDPRVSRYRDVETGRFVSAQEARALVDQSIGASSNVALTLATMLTDGEITLDMWQEAMREEIKREYIRQYLVGRGGRANMTAEDWGSIGGMINEQYRFLSGPHPEGKPTFFDRVSTGLYTPESIAHIAAMYLNSAREAYERANERTLKANGFDEVRWVLEAGAEHCEGCLHLAGQGYVPIGELGTYPGGGDTPCLTACKCHLEYLRSTDGQVRKVYYERESSQPIRD